MGNETVSSLLLMGKQALIASGINSFAIDTLVLLMWATGLDKVSILTKPELSVSAEQANRFKQAINKRAAHMPVQYITHECEFMSLNFYVNENVLIPRPDTETAVETTIDLIKKNGYIKVLDLCTGSGCIAVSLAHYCKETCVTAVDISKEALKIAQKNACLNGVLDRITFIQADILTNWQPTESYDLIISNPPYIKHEVLKTLDKNVIYYEPTIALDGGADGLTFYKKITETSATSLKNGGTLIFEIGYDQANEVLQIMKQHNFTNLELKKDLSRNDRVFTGTIQR